MGMFDRFAFFLELEYSWFAASLSAFIAGWFIALYLCRLMEWRTVLEHWVLIAKGGFCNCMAVCCTRRSDAHESPWLNGQLSSSSSKGACQRRSHWRKISRCWTLLSFTSAGTRAHRHTTVSFLVIQYAAVLGPSIRLQRCDVACLR